MDLGKSSSQGKQCCFWLCMLLCCSGMNPGPLDHLTRDSPLNYTLNPQLMLLYRVFYVSYFINFKRISIIPLLKMNFSVWAPKTGDTCVSFMMLSFTQICIHIELLPCPEPGWANKIWSLQSVRGVHYSCRVALPQDPPGCCQLLGSVICHVHLCELYHDFPRDRNLWHIDRHVLGGTVARYLKWLI